MWIDDVIIRQCDKPQVLSTWIPETSCVVLGSGNKAEKECQVDYCQHSGIQILKRYGGGGTVLLHSGCVIVSYGSWVKRPFDNSLYFRILNDSIIETLSEEWPNLIALHQKGISDIAYGTKKICGTSLFRSKSYLLYQASILVESRVDEIDAALLHPTKEPEYRQGKNHQEFLTGLSEIVKGLKVSNVKTTLEKWLPEKISSNLKAEFIQPDLKHRKHLLNRVSRNST